MSKKYFYVMTFLFVFLFSSVSLASDVSNLIHSDIDLPFDNSKFTILSNYSPDDCKKIALGYKTSYDSNNGALYYYTLFSNSEVVLYVEEKPDDYGSIAYGICSLQPISFSGNINAWNDYTLDWFDHPISEQYIISSPNTENLAIYSTTLLSRPSLYYEYYSWGIPFNDVKVFDSYDSAKSYLVNGDTSGMLDDGIESHFEDISFKNFKVVPHKSASFDNFYFEVRYELSPYVQNNLENATITFTQKYEGSLLVEHLKGGSLDDVAVSGSGFCHSYSYGPYSKSSTISLKYARAGFTPYLKDMVIFDNYLKDAFPIGYVGFDYVKKMQLLGYGSWQQLGALYNDNVWKYKPESSRLYFIGNISVNGETGKPFTFCYDFLEGRGETEYTPWEEDEPNPEPIVDTVVPDDDSIVDTSTDGSGININIDIDNNNGGGSGEYVDVNPDDYRSFIDMYKDTMGEFKTEGNTFEFLKGAMSCLPADIWALIAGGLGACIVISLIVIFRGR